MHSTKNGNPISPASPSALRSYLLAARPKTWSASLCPVLIGSSLAARETSIAWGTFLLTLLFSLLIQIGTNYANDYFDFMKGADTPERKGPKRAVSEGWIAPRSMLFATILAFSLALFIALPLMLATGIWSLGIASLCVLFGVIYTGGPRPLGYAGLGELLVLIFFGPVAVMGAYFLQTNTVNLSVFIASIAPGLLSAAILLANNLRDERTDRIANKKTIVVRFGSMFGKWTYCALILGSILVPIVLTAWQFPLKLLGASFVLLFAPIQKVFRSVEVLQETSLLLLAYTLVFSALLW